MMDGIHNRIVHVNLSSGEVTEERPPDSLYRLLVGGRALVAYLLLRDLPPRTDPLSPANRHDVNRAAGRNGLGALMGSKNLKAVAVRGTTNVQIADRQPVTSVAKWLGKNYKELAAWAAEGIGRGTQDSLAHWAYVGRLPVKKSQRAGLRERGVAERRAQCL